MRKNGASRFKTKCRCDAQTRLNALFAVHHLGVVQKCDPEIKEIVDYFSANCTVYALWALLMAILLVIACYNEQFSLLFRFPQK